MDPGQTYPDLPRRKLQLLCKQAGLRANATNKEMAEALSRLAKARSVAENSGTSSLVPAVPKLCTDLRLEESIPEGSEVVIGRKDAAATGEAERQLPDVNTKEVNQNQGTKAAPGPLQSESLEPVLGSGNASQEDEHVNSSEIGAGLDIEGEKDLSLTGDSTASEEDENSQKPDQAEEQARAVGKDSLGGLAQELLCAETIGATAAPGSHRGLVKKVQIVHKGREVRVKRAMEKGTVERSMLIVERRGGGSNKSLGQPTNFGATTEPARETAEPHASVSLDKQSVLRSPVISSTEETGQTGGTVITEKLPAATVMGGEVAKKDGTRANGGDTKFEEGAPGAETESGSVGQDGLDAEKENDPPAEASEPQEAKPEKEVEPCPGKERAETVPAIGNGGGLLLPLGIATTTGLLADEEQSAGGQSTYKRCYKSRPFSAPGVEKRALAAAKKGAGQRDAILAERRILA